MKKGEKAAEEEDIPLHVAHQDVFLAKKLAHPEKKVRDQALKKLTNWLAVRDNFSEIEMMKVWKGLFYCFWNTDKPIVQMELAERLSGLLFVFKGSVDHSCLFIQTFFITLQREWVGIDRLRLDKYLLFIRFFIRHIFVYMGVKNDWDPNLVLRVSEILTEHAVGKATRNNALGLLFHISEVYLTECGVVLRSKEKGEGEKKESPRKGKKKEKADAKKAKEEEKKEENKSFVLAESMTPEVFVLLLSPFLDVMASAEDRSCAQRVHKAVFLELLVDIDGNVTVPAPAGTPPFFTHFLPATRGRFLELLSQNFFQVAATGKSTLDKNRRRLYSYRERLQQEVAKYKTESIEAPDATPEREEEEEMDTPPSSRKRKRLVRVLTPHPAAEQGPTAADATPDAKPEPIATRARQKRLSQDLEAASTSSPKSSSSSSSSPPSPSPSTSSLESEMEALEAEIAGRTRAKRRKKADTPVESTPTKKPPPGSPVTPVAKKEKRKVYFDLGQNKIQEAREALKHHPPIPSPLKVPASPAIRAMPKRYPAPPKSPGLAGLRTSK